MRIVVAMPEGAIRDSFIPDPAVFLPIAGMEEIVWNPLSRQWTAEELSDVLSETGAQVVVTGWGCPRLDAPLLSRAPQLSLIAHTGGSVAGLVDAAAFEHGIAVYSGNDLYARSVAESVIAYSLTMLRDIPRYTSELRTEGWSAPDWYNEGLLGQRVGLVGFGAVARHTAELLRAFGCTILVCMADFLTEEAAASYGVRKASAEGVFSTCKIVSLHTALTPETYHSIDRRLLSLLRPDSIFVNTARGAIVEETALAEMLAAGRFRAILDVYETEPLSADSPLRKIVGKAHQPSPLVLMPHMGGPTIDRRPRVTAALVEAIAGYRAGQAESPLRISREMAERMTR